jgi:hypothetical protein
MSGNAASEQDLALASYAQQIARRQAEEEAASRQEFIGLLGETLPGQIVRELYGAVTLPGDVYAGKVDPRSDEAIQRSFDLAGALTMGAGVVPAGRNEMRMGIKAYHGSPHDFDQFSMSKIGTGEGAQAYGHGLYFAEKEGIAKGYRDALKPGKGMTPTDTAARAIDGSGGDVAAALKAISERIDDAAARGVPYDEIKSLMQAKNILNVQPQRATGRMYEVELNTTPDRLLDWDKPLREQSDAIRRALGWTPDAEKAYKAAQGADDNALLNALMGDGGAYNAARLPVPKGVPPLSATGADIAKGNSLFREGSDAYRAQGLREKGIDGIKYLDAGSRTPIQAQDLTRHAADLDRRIGLAEREIASMPASVAADYRGHIDTLKAERIALQRKLEPSSNYVMFDDKLIKILRKYGVATAAALPAAALAELGMTKQEAERTF